MWSEVSLGSREQTVYGRRPRMTGRRPARRPCSEANGSAGVENGWNGQKKNGTFSIFFHSQMWIQDWAWKNRCTRGNSVIRMEMSWLAFRWIQYLKGFQSNLKLLHPHGRFHMICMILLLVKSLKSNLSANSVLAESWATSRKNLHLVSNRPLWSPLYSVSSRFQW